MSHDLPPERIPRRLSLLSVVAPVYNEETTIDEFYRRTRRAIEMYPFEIVMVDDGSTDSTSERLREIAAGDSHVRVIRLTRNFGHQAALTAGLDHAEGDAIAMIDADLQDPPEVLPQLLEHWQSGSDVVYAVRQDRQGESRFKLATASGFYRLFSALAHIKLEPNAGDFRLLDRRALDSLSTLRERNRFLRGMTVWIGYTQTAVGFDRDPRFAGSTKFTLRKMLRFSLDAIFSFSFVPLQLATLLGFLFSLVAFLAIPVAIAFRLAGQFVPGITTILFVVLLLGGIQLITVGIIGEYIGRVYDEVKGRPLYLVENVFAVNEGAAARTSERREDDDSF